MKKKICTKCDKEYPATRECFSSDKQYKDGLYYGCRFCKRKYPDTIKGHLWQVYANIEKRCNNPKHKDYKYYGGRGIENKFESLNDFRDYVVNILKVDPRGLQIDRINNNGNYEPGNIRFITAKENCRNRRNNVE